MATIDIVAQTVEERKSLTVSFSALESYKNCSEFYKNKYVQKIKVDRPIQKALQVGSWAHELIEAKLKDPMADVKEVFKSSLPEWLQACGVTYNSEQLVNLIAVSSDLAKLLYRASSHCTDSSKIRNSNGTVLKSPINYPSSSFKTELAKLPTYRYKSVLELESSKQNPEFLELSLVWHLAEALFLGDSFEFPSWADKTLHTELAFGTEPTNLVPLVEDEDGELICSLLGYIDWVVQLVDGRVAVVDHKSSANNPTQLDVIYHPQLNLYAYAYKVLYGKLPDIIGINHIRSGVITLAEPNPVIVNSTVEYYRNIYINATEGPYIRKHPNDYQSPCVKKDYTSNKVTSVCPYLEICWGNYKKLLS